MPIREPYPACRQRVDVRRLHIPAKIAAKIPNPLVIRVDNDEIRPVTLRLCGSGPCQRPQKLSALHSSSAYNTSHRPPVQLFHVSLGEEAPAPL